MNSQAKADIKAVGARRRGEWRAREKQRYLVRAKRQHYRARCALGRTGNFGTANSCTERESTLYSAPLEGGFKAPVKKARAAIFYIERPIVRVETA